MAAWIVVLAGLSLVLNDPDGDDAFYGHQSAWIAAHGSFPLRDVVYSDGRFPALYFPPVSSYEALTGALAWLAGIRAADFVYLVVPPLGSALAVLALWRLLRVWRVPLVGLALTAAVVFLLFDAADHTTFGEFFVSRLWQGKALLLTIALPVLLARLHEQAERPSAGGLCALGLCGAAAVGLSTTAIFAVPVLAAGALIAPALRAPRRPAAALAAACAYPVGAAVVTKLSGGRTPDVYTAADVVSAKLVHIAFGSGGLALLALGAALLAPALLPRAGAGAMVAGIALLLGVLLAPDVPRAIFDFSGLGRVLWRLTWALPVAAAVGAAAVCAGRIGSLRERRGVVDGARSVLARGRRAPRVALTRGRRTAPVAPTRGRRAPRLAQRATRLAPTLLQAAPALALCAALAVFGTPVWSRSSGTRVAGHPVLKRDPGDLADARAILRRARPGDLVLARRGLSQTLLVLSGTVTTVSPRGFFTRALADQPGMHAAARARLQHAVRFGLPTVPPTRPEVASLRRDLRRLHVELACPPRFRAAVRHALRRAGYRRVLTTRRITCLRAP